MGNDTQLKLAALLGAAFLAISQSDRPIDDPKMWALAGAAGCAALVTLLRPPSNPPAAPQFPRGDSGRG